MGTAVQLAKRKEVAVNCIVSTMLPHLLKTEKIKQMNPKEDFTKLLPTDKIAPLVLAWAKGINRPDNGSFVEFKMDAGHAFPYFV